MPGGELESKKSNVSSTASFFGMSLEINKVPLTSNPINNPFVSFDPEDEAKRTAYRLLRDDSRTARKI